MRSQSTVNDESDKNSDNAGKESIPGLAISQHKTHLLTLGQQEITQNVIN